MARRRRVASARPDQPFKGRQFTAEVILWAMRWYLMFPISYRGLELMLADRGVEVAHHPLPLDPRVCARNREADPATSAAEQWLVEGRRDLRSGEGLLEVLVPRGG